jgi:hypothetical protein
MNRSRGLTTSSVRVLNWYIITQRLTGSDYLVCLLGDVYHLSVKQHIEIREMTQSHEIRSFSAQRAGKLPKDIACVP